MTFSKGDEVRCINSDGSGGELAVGANYTVSATRDFGKLGPQVRVNGAAYTLWWREDRFEKAEPEWVVGQQVSGDDYERLPVSAVVEMLDKLGKSVGNPSWTKRDDGLWYTHAVLPGADLSELGDKRTLTHLPDATEPEDTDDVEPEPLKVGDAALVWVRVDKPAMNGGTRVYTVTEDGGEWDAITRPDAIVRPDAGQVPPWVKPAQCTSLWEASPNDYARCIKDEHDDTERHNRPGVFWTTAEEYGRVEVSS